MPDKKEKKGLGRGLSALMADIDPPGKGRGSLRQDQISIAIDQIEANPDQPRKSFSAAELEDLKASIRAKGIIQPLIVRPKPNEPDRYQIVAGERRWRAAQRAQLHDVPAIVRDMSDTEMLEIAIIENVQRSDLNPVEEALAYKSLQDRFGHTQDALSNVLGKSRSHIGNLMRLLTLPEDVLDLVRSRQLSAGHARALVVAPNASELAKLIVSRDLSVREAERLAKSATGKTARKSGTRSNSKAKDADTIALEQDLSAATGLKVSIDHVPGQEHGVVTLKYRSLSQLDWICQALSRTN